MEHLTKFVSGLSFEILRFAQNDTQRLLVRQCISAVHVVFFVQRNLSHEALSRCRRKRRPRRRRIASQEFSAAAARQRRRSARHQARRSMSRPRSSSPKLLLKQFPEHALYGEEGIVGDQSSEHQWVVDPLDGTVNYFYGIPHFCVSIALRCERRDHRRRDLRSDARRNVERAKRRKADAERSAISRERSRGSCRSGDLGRTREDRRDDRCEFAVVPGNGSSRAQMPRARQRRARHGVRRVRTTRRLHRTGNQSVGHRGRMDSGRNAGGTVDLRPREDMKDKYSIVASNGVIDLKIVSMTRCGIGYDVHRLGRGSKTDPRAASKFRTRADSKDIPMRTSCRTRSRMHCSARSARATSVIIFRTPMNRFAASAASRF